MHLTSLVLLGAAATGLATYTPRDTSRSECATRSRKFHNSRPKLSQSLRSDMLAAGAKLDECNTFIDYPSYLAADYDKYKAKSKAWLNKYVAQLSTCPEFKQDMASVTAMPDKCFNDMPAVQSAVNTLRNGAAGRHTAVTVVVAVAAAAGIVAAL